MRSTFTPILLGSLVSFVLLGTLNLNALTPHTFSQGASVFPIPLEPENLQEKFNNAPSQHKKVRILIVPGHEPDFGGAEYRDIKERDLAVDLAENLYAYLSNDPHYEIALSRNKTSWNEDLDSYFETHWQDIQEFILSKKQIMANLVAQGLVVPRDNNIYHNDAPSDVATRLYGINAWADAQHADIVIHIHFNDSATRNDNNPDEYSGMAIYVPERQYGNAHLSQAIADKIIRRLEAISATSNLPHEDAGIVEEQELIAIGANNSVSAASMLIEYGYIYEPQFVNPRTRTVVLRELAYQTYLGISDFFQNTPEDAEYLSTLIPHTWEKTLQKGKNPEPEVLATQTALMREGLYPPLGSTKNDCPVNGVYGKCTEIALRDFQNRFNIPGNGTRVGPQTRAKLNELYGRN